MKPFNLLRQRPLASDILLIGVVMSPSANAEAALLVRPASDDPWEGFNRAAPRSNQGQDRSVTGPVARGYRRVARKAVRKGLSTVVANLGVPPAAVNALAQGRARAAGTAAGRFLINSTASDLGLLDTIGLEGHQSELGVTLGRYCAEAGRYVALPPRGPATLRNGTAVGGGGALTDPVSLATPGGSSRLGMVHSNDGAFEARASTDGIVRAMAECTDPYAIARPACHQDRAPRIEQARASRQLASADAARNEP